MLGNCNCNLFCLMNTFFSNVLMVYLLSIHGHLRTFVVNLIIDKLRDNEDVQSDKRGVITKGFATARKKSEQLETLA